MNCEHNSYDEPFPGIFLFCSLDKIVIVFLFFVLLFFFKNVREDLPKGLFAQTCKEVK